nr:aldo/keto reductase [Agrobacterium rosae]
MERLTQLETICHEYGVSLAAAALQFGLGHPSVVSVLPGVAGTHRVSDTLSLAQEKIPAGFWSALRDRGVIAAEAPFPL